LLITKKKKNETMDKLIVFTSLSDEKKKKIHQAIVTHIIKLVTRPVIKFILIPALFGSAMDKQIKSTINTYYDSLIIPGITVKKSYLSMLKVITFLSLRTSIKEIILKRTHFNRWTTLVHSILNVIIEERTDFCSIRKKNLVNVQSKDKPYLQLHLPDGTSSWFYYAQSLYFDGYKAKTTIYNIDRNTSAVLANVGHAIDGSILRMIMSQLQAKNIEAIPLHDCLKVSSLNIDKTQSIVQDVYTDLHLTRDVWVYNLFCKDIDVKSLLGKKINKLVIDFLKQNPAKPKLNVKKNIFQ
jgi:hypothetical protein